MTARVRWAVVGTSSFVETAVVPAIRSVPDAELVAIVSRRPKRISMEDVAVVGDLAELPALGVDVVQLVVPNVLHLPLALEALALGMHVVVEKPLAVSPEDAAEMLAAAQSAGRLLAVGSCMAWSPVVTAIERRIGDGAIGAVRHASISAGFDAGLDRGWRQTSTTAQGGGVLLDLGSHAVDALTRLLGPIVSVTGELSTTLPGVVADDTCALLLRHASGATSALHVAFTHGCNELTVVGDEGELASREWLGRTFRGDLVWRPNADARLFDGPGGSVIDELAGAEPVDVVARQTDEVTRSILTGTEPLRASAAAGERVVEVLAAAVASSELGRRIEVGIRR